MASETYHGKVVFVNKKINTGMFERLASPSEAIHGVRFSGNVKKLHAEWPWDKASYT